MASYQRNLAAVGEHLDENESIIESCGGVYEVKLFGMHDDVRRGIFIVTEKRVVFFAKWLMGYDLESFPLSKISAIEISKSLMGKSINMKMPGNTVEIKWIQSGEPNKLVAYVRENMGEETPVRPDPASEDILAQIQKLAALKDQGILTEDEFTAKKTELLAKM